MFGFWEVLRKNGVYKNNLLMSDQIMANINEN